MRQVLGLFAAALVTLATPVSAAELRCRGEGVERGGRTRYRVRTRGTDYAIERSGRTVGHVRKRGDRYVVEISGRSVATIELGRIYRSGSTWARVADAQRVFDCPDVVAAALWVLQQHGRL
jgi:hypothetical protein